MKRRDVLFGLVALPVAASLLTLPDRGPYVMPGEWVDSIVFHLWDLPMVPLGPLSVHEVLPWDGKGYPIVLAKHGWREEDKLLYDGWYDYEWANFRREVPEHFWALHGNKDRYPNVHAFIREQRFGEHPSVMRQTMARNHDLGPAAFAPRPERLPRKAFMA